LVVKTTLNLGVLVFSPHTTLLLYTRNYSHPHSQSLKGSL
jgi:hypothetical protein